MVVREFIFVPQQLTVATACLVCHHQVTIGIIIMAVAAKVEGFIILNNGQNYGQTIIMTMPETPIATITTLATITAGAAAAAAAITMRAAVGAARAM